MIPLFEQYPRLAEALPYAALADLPTPVERLDRLGAEFAVGQLFIKRDDQTGALFGGNKVRKLEFLLGNKNSKLVEVHRHDAEAYTELKRVLAAPSLYDVVLRKLSGDGFDIAADKLERDFSQPYEADDSVQSAWLAIYSDPEKYFELYELAEKLVDIEDAFQAWRFKHMYTVQRIIGSRPGTGGSSGVPFLKKAIETSFFPELFAIRTDL